MNNVNLIGRLTANPELRTTSTGKSTCKFTLAVQRDAEHTDFIVCDIWHNQAENLCKYCEKGSLLGISGSIETGSYIDRNNNKVYTTEILVNRVQFLDNKKNDAKYETKLKQDEAIVTDADLPF